MKVLSWLFAGAAACSTMFLSGCTLSTTDVGLPQAGPSIQGRVMGGDQPITGSTVQLYAVGATGYGSASTPLLKNAVTSGAGGNFTLTNDFTCPSSTTLVYLAVTGGNPGLRQYNPQISELAALGQCGSLTSSTFLVINEKTTVAAVWALAPFMKDYADIGSSATNAVGLQNAFLSASELASVSVAGGDGTLAANVTAPTAEVNTLADILAACVNSSGGTSGDGTLCGNLFQAVTATGQTAPVETVGAALAIAQNPGLNVGTLFGYQSAVAPFQPVLSTAPNDWTITLAYNNPALQGGSQFINMAIDANQQIWVAYGQSPSACQFCGTIDAVFEYGQDLTLESPSTGYTDASLNGAYAIAFDLTGNLWVTDANAANLTEFGSSGSFVKSVTGGGLAGPGAIAIDKGNNIWVGNFGSTSVPYTGVSEFTNAGTALSPATGYTGGGASYYQNAIALDSLGNAWVSAAQGMTELGPLGVAISPSTTYGKDAGNSVAIDGSGNVWTGVNYTGLAAYRSTGSEFSPSGGFTGGGLQGGLGVAVDGAEHIWAINTNFYQQPNHVGALSEFSQGGAALTPSTGLATVGLGSLSLSIDGAGNIWWPGVGTLYKCIGVAAPVVTPIAVATATGKLGARP